MGSFSTRSKGNKGEKVALEFLQAKGYKLIEKNFYCRGGEIDLVMQDKDFIVFIEVKSINEDTEYSIYETLTTAKKKKLKRAVNLWITKNNYYLKPWRLDFIGIIYQNNNSVKTIEHFEFISF